MERKINQKLKIVEFESNYSPVATQYNYSDDILSNKKEKIDIWHIQIKVIRNLLVV